ncbi:MAG: glutamate synthase large subunit [Coriobacteriales bacterium]|jgi:glutamate synthase (ferredoxin)|nr:glutamate synthase large subunit [Coriobacteriales bacterium]
MSQSLQPEKQGLYDPQQEHDACGIGMLVDIRGQKSHTMVSDAIEVLNRLKHRGGAGSEKDTGDGAGLLLQIPHAFFAAASETEGRTLPQEGDYGVAMLFASPEEERCGATLRRFEQIVDAEGLKVLWIRHVPANHAAIGRTAALVCPSIYQIFVERPAHAGFAEFERALYALSKLATQAIRAAEKDADPYFYVLSCSSKTVVYKGMLLPRQLAAFYLDLLDERVESAIVLVHSRFSTNTFPSWERAHPQRILIHNGEINTIRGNVNWTKSRQARFSSPLFGEELSRLFPVIDEDGSDSAMLDDFIRFLVAAGYSLPHALAMAVPEPYENNPHMPEDRRAFYEYHNCLSEPWDGPAALAFSDGVLCGALLDRNGLRPSRYTVTKQGVLVLASEIGVYDVPADEVATQGRIQPGEMLLVDTRAGRIIEDGELKAELADERPYAQWLQHGLRSLDELADGVCAEPDDAADTAAASPTNTVADAGAGAEAEHSSPLSPTQLERLFGYTWEDLTLTLRGMAESKDDPIGSMGTDIPLAVLSERPQLLYSYFKQLFAQVTNPPIDSLREKNVVSSSILLGSEGNLLEPSGASCRFIKHPTPVLLPEELQQLTRLDTDDFKSIVLPMVSPAVRGSLEPALDELFEAADRAVAGGHNILILSDAGADATHAPIPALLACSGLHHHLVRAGTRTACSLVVAAGDAWETHHLAMLIGFGANAVCPHRAFATLDGMVREGQLSGSAEAARCNYVAAATKGIVKTMSKMGISTVRSYHGAQVFEALGMGEAVIERYFTGTISRIGGLGIEHIEAEVLTRHAEALASDDAEAPLPAGGNYKWRAEGEYHLFSPDSIFYLQQACKTGDFELFKTYSAEINRRSEQLKNIRSLFDIRLAEKPVSLETVESEESIVRRFKTGAMSYGSISAEAHESLALAMNRLGAKSNTGEGGEDPARFVPDSNGESRCSAIKQVASARFGVTIEYLSNAREIQIKMAQGAKPGEGGHLPGAKVYPWIAACRHATPGVELISPPPHHDIYSIEDLAQLIHDLKNANPAARISVKLVSEAGVGTVAVGVAKGLADVIVVSGYDGGTGAAARTSIRHAGLPWELGVAETHQSLLLNGLRNRVTLETDGKLLTGRDIVIAALLGAEEFAFATSPLIALGCDMMRVCNLDSCPVGIATQNPLLRSKFRGGPEYVENLMRFLAREVRDWMSRMGLRSFNDLVGRTELLRQWCQADSPKAQTVDLSALMYQPKASDSAGERYFQHAQQHHLSRYMDEAVLIPLCERAIEHGQAVEYELPIGNQDRTVGCRLSGTIALKYGSAGLPPDTIRLRFTGYAGQSFGAFVGPGISLYLVGGANDYLGKGLCGGSITVTQPKPLLQSSAENTTIGNVSFFGATSGEGYISGRAGERFCVRNSGATVVVEGVGDHGCEYMTGGVAVVLGTIGRNFAAGMSGGIAYLYDPSGSSRERCNLSKAALYPLDEADRTLLRELLDRHIAATASPVARRIRNGNEAELDSFIKLVPDEYKKVLDALADERIQALEPDEQLLAAFHAVTAAA